MKKTLFPTLVLALTLTGGLLPAQASELDAFLSPRCGVGEPEFQVEDILRRFGPEIYSRATGFQILDADISNEILMWYLGSMKDDTSRQLAEQVVRNGSPSFRRMVMGAVSFSPDWSGLRLVAIGAMDRDEETRDSASSILADVDVAQLARTGARIPGLRQEIVQLLTTQISAETNPRLKGNLQTALQKLQSVQVSAGN
ncbi:MAG: hypothetical protein GEEBNDBF_01960 [bacterium]|nr:hypothetical protein [bacterium]